MNNSAISLRSAAANCRCLAASFIVLVSACGTVRQTPQPSFYSIDSHVNVSEVRSPVSSVASLPAASTSAPTLIINPPHAASGFDSKHLIYSREAHKLDYFAHSEWIDTPARMLAPLIADAVDKTGMFRAVLLTPSAASGDLRLDTEIVRLQQDFDRQPSRVRFTLRAYLVDNTTRKILAWREFDEAVDSPSENPYGGVVAANQAVRMSLTRLALFCAETSLNWTPVATRLPEKR
ncbi:ABC-type transport auxiliary lipoprotein family protein [Undibacterium sp. Jales W-56]|uniref:ABC-type transport auxiliary lipoprotein family protein n=1 Tax=Undibacterium sp. Jales W-56 TaxID=2897325 RepID=UPI0021D3EA50|nr:ABC-type transport auxiliary lipoprotein family protein [Undibacterium sp. Jales W-56]MCU6435009.1 ABC-type transport auxiliary lipoprotein family protein [Undibacterium sp. Jales W-56]